jgi:ribosomal protein L40E
MPEAIPNLGPDLARCPHCGAGNPAGATWCGQCLRRFDETEPRTTAAASAPAGASIVTELRPNRARPVVRAAEDGEEPVWTCPACDTENPLSASACARCGSKFVSFFGAARDEKPRASRNGALAAAAALPGAGHWIYRQTGPAVARAVIYLWTVAISIMLLGFPPRNARGLVRGIGAVFALAGVTVWLASMLETLRLGEGDPRPLIPPKALTWFAAALSGVLMLGLIAAVVAGR